MNIHIEYSGKIYYEMPLNIFGLNRNSKNINWHDNRAQAKLQNRYLKYSLKIITDKKATGLHDLIETRRRKSWVVWLSSLSSTNCLITMSLFIPIQIFGTVICFQDLVLSCSVIITAIHTTSFCALS